MPNKASLVFVFSIWFCYCNAAFSLLSFVDIEASNVGERCTHNTEKTNIFNNKVVWTEPAFPSQLDDVTVYYDSKEGNGALSNFMGVVYAHTGIISSFSTSPTDWRYVQGVWGTADPSTRMTNEGNGVYSMQYNITNFYGIPSGEAVQQLAFVFRNASGSIVGRASDGSDIYTDVYPPDEGILASLVSPSQMDEIIYLGEYINLQLEINKSALVRVIDNDMEVYTATTNNVNIELTPQNIGKHDVVIEISDDIGNMQVINTSYFVIEADIAQSNPPTGVEDGLNYTSTGDFIFQLYAPGKKHVFLLCPANNYRVASEYQLLKSIDGSSFWIELSRELFDGGDNTYQYLVDGTIRIADPYSELVLDPSNDGGVSDDVTSELPDYPSGASGILTVFDVEKESYNWQINDFEAPNKTELIIYEILLRDFLEDHSYQSLIDTLDYIDRLGVTAIELMPINEFEGNQSWGYNPSFHGAIDKYYGSRDQLKAFINACHARGIAVILDVVFNHVFSQSPLAQLYWDTSNFRPTTDNPWLNVTARHPYNVGYDVNHESPATKKWVKKILTSMLEDYRFDGFRFDLSKGFTQLNSIGNEDLMARYDASRINILKDYADHVWEINSDTYVILEHFAYNDEEKVLADYGMMLWGNMSYNFQEAAMGYASDISWIDYQKRAWSQPNLVSYMESHDEERMMYKILKYGNSGTNYSTQSLSTALSRVEAAHLIYTVAPGPKMSWQFGELGYDYSINTCTNGIVNNDCRLDPKPILWDYQNENARRRLYDRCASINYLKALPAFSTTDYRISDLTPYIKTVHLNHSDMNVVAIANYNVEEVDITPSFQTTGIWYEYFTGQQIDINNTEIALCFYPGEYRLYTDKKVIPPTGFVSNTTSIHEAIGHIYPNPSISGGKITIENLDVPKIDKIQLVDLNGIVLSLPYQRTTISLIIDLPLVSTGVYELRLFHDDKIFSSKLVILEP